MSYLIILVSIIVAILTIIISPFFIEEFFPKYSDGIPSLQILIISIIPLTITAIFNAKLQAKESTVVGYSAVVRIGSLLILLTIFGYFYDLLGLSLAVFFSIVLNTIFLYIVYKKSKKHSYNI